MVVYDAFLATAPCYTGGQWKSLPLLKFPFPLVVSAKLAFTKVPLIEITCKLHTNLLKQTSTSTGMKLPVYVSHTNTICDFYL